MVIKYQYNKYLSLAEYLLCGTKAFNLFYLKKSSLEISNPITLFEPAEK